MTIPDMVTAITAGSKTAPYQPPNKLAGVLLWPVWPLLDPHTARPSGPRCFAWAVYVAFLCNRPIPATVVGLLLATMFGYTMFKSALSKASFNVTDASAISLKQESTTNRTITETITDVRGMTGEALRSLAAKVDAKTPAGDD